MDAWDEFRRASEGNAPDAIIELFQAGRNGRNECGPEGSALALSADANDVAVARQLIELGANVNYPMPEYGLVALHAAASQDSVYIKTANSVRSEYFFSPHCGEAPLHLAAAYCGVDFVKLLLSSGADRDAVDANGATAVDYLRRHWNSDRDIAAIHDETDNWPTH